MTYDPLLPIQEGQSFNLCCYSKRNVPHQTFRWSDEKHGIRIENYHSSKACIYFQTIFRNDSGTYTCTAEYRDQTLAKNVTLLVSCK